MNTSEAKTEIASAAAEAVKAIAAATEAAAKVISSAAGEASKVVTTNASQTAKTLEVRGSDDHDRLVVLDTKMDAISDQIKDLRDNNTKRIDELERTKLDISDSYEVKDMAGNLKRMEDCTLRITELEISKIRITVMIGIASGILTILVGLLVSHMFIV